MLAVVLPILDQGRAESSDDESGDEAAAKAKVDAEAADIAKCKSWQWATLSEDEDDGVASWFVNLDPIGKTAIVPPSVVVGDGDIADFVGVSGRRKKRRRSRSGHS